MATGWRSGKLARKGAFSAVAAKADKIVLTNSMLGKGRSKSPGGLPDAEGKVQALGTCVTNQHEVSERATVRRDNVIKLLWRTDVMRQQLIIGKQDFQEVNYRFC